MSVLNLSGLNVVEVSSYSNGDVYLIVTTFKINNTSYKAVVKYISGMSDWSISYLGKLEGKKQSFFKDDKRLEILQFILDRTKAIRKGGLRTFYTNKHGKVLHDSGLSYNVTNEIKKDSSHKIMAPVETYTSSYNGMQIIKPRSVAIIELTQNVDFIKSEDNKEVAPVMGDKMLTWNITPDKHNIEFIMSCLALARGGNRAVQFIALDLKITIREDQKHIILDKKIEYDRYKEIFNKPYTATYSMLASYICQIVSSGYGGVYDYA